MLELLKTDDLKTDTLKEANLKRARYVVEQAENQKAVLAHEEEDYWKICRALATLGDAGRDLFLRTIRIGPGYDQLKASADFTAEQKRGKFKNPAKFFQLAGDAGLKTKPPITLRKAKEEVTGRDFLGEFYPTFNQFGFWEEAGLYWAADKIKWDRYEISNFTMKFLFFLKKDKNTSFRLVSIKNTHGHEATIFVNTDEMVTVGSFKRILEREGAFLFKGSDTDLSNIKDKLQHGEKKTTLVTQLGWNHYGFYAWANGISCPKDNKFMPVDEYGTVEFNTKDKDGQYSLRHYFIPANAKMFEELEREYTDDKKFIYQPSDLTFEDWSEQFTLVYGEHGQMIMVYYFMALFSDIIFRSMGRRFPIFALCGLPFSGKGTIAESIMRMFGIAQDQVMLDGASTDKAVMRTFSQFSNALVWLDEYLNSLKGIIIGCIKNIYDRKGYKRAKKDNTFETEISPVLSPCILTGQDMPSINPALFSRVILRIKTGANYTEQQRENFRTLEGMEAAGVSGITHMLLQYRGYFEQHYRAVFDAEYKKLARAVNNNEVSIRMLSNYGAMIATAELLSTKISLPFTMDEFTLNCKNTMMQHFFIMKGSDDLGKFWDIFQVLFNNGSIQEEVQFKTSDGFLYLRVDEIYQLYAEAMSARKDPNALEKQTLKAYLETAPLSFVENTRVRFNGKQCRVLKFNYSELDIDLIAGGTKEERRAKRIEMNVKEEDDEDEQDFDDPED